MATLVEVVAGSGKEERADGYGRAAGFDRPEGIAVSAAGILYVADTFNYKIRQLNPSTREVTSIVDSPAIGNADGHGTGAGAGAGPRAKVNRPSGIAVAPSGLVYIADTMNHRIRIFDPRTGMVTTLAGSVDGFAEGVGAAAQFNTPTGIAVAPSGIVYVADMLNDRIRQIDPATGAVTTLAGSGYGFAEGVGAAARFAWPSGLAVAPSGVLYVADTYNHRIRQIDPATGAVTTLAGSAAGFADGIGPAAQFRCPHGVAVDRHGVVYVADTDNHRIRQIDANTRTVTTLAGSGLAGDADGFGPERQFDSPCGVAVSPSGIVYVADTGHSLIQSITVRPGLSFLRERELGRGLGRGLGGPFPYHAPAAAAAAAEEPEITRLNRRSTRLRRTRKHRSRKTRRTSRR